MKKLLFLPLILILLVLNGCAEQTANADFDMQTAKIGVMTGTMAEVYADANYPKENILGYDAVVDTIAALLANKIDAVITADITAINIAGKNPDLKVYGERLTDEEAAVGVAKENPELLAQFNETIARLKADGTLEDMKKRWIKLDGSAVEPVEIPQTGEKILRVGISAEREPFCYLDADGNAAGLCVELAQRMGEAYGYKIEFVLMKFSGLVPSLESGKIDAIVDVIFVTEERKQKIDFSDSYYMSGQIALVRADTVASTDVPKQNTGADFDIQKAKIGVMTGTTGERFTLENYPNENISGYEDVMDAVAALIAGKVDAVITADVTAKNIANHNLNLEVLGTTMTNENIAAGISKENTELLAGIDEIIAELEADGTLADMKARWIKTDGSAYEPVSIPNTTGEVLRIGTAAMREPFAFRNANGEIIGYAPELAYRIGEKLGRKIEFVDMKFGALISSLQSGKIDVIVDLMTATDERKEQINFTRPYYVSGQVILKRKDAETTSYTGILSLAQLREPGRKIGVPTGAKADLAVQEQFTDAVVVQYNSVGEGFIAVKTGKIDAFCFDKNVMQYTINENPDLMLLNEVVAKNDLVIGAGTEQLLAEVNSAIAVLNASKAYGEMRERWLGSNLNPVLPEITPAENPKGKLIIGTSYENRPMNYLDGNNNPVGFDVEYAMRLAAVMNYEIEIQTMDWSALIPSLQSGKIDLLIANLNATEERRQTMLLSDVYAETDIVMMVKSSAVPAAQNSFRAEDFVGKKIAVLTGSAFDSIIEENIPGAEVSYFNTVGDTITAVQTGKTDALMLDDAELKLVVAQNPDLKLLEPLVTNNEYAVMLGKGNTELKAQLDEFITLIMEDGTYDNMLRRWLDEAGEKPMPDISEGKGATLTFATAPLAGGFSYMKDGELTGFDIELARRFAAHLDRKLEIISLDFSGILPAIQSGKADFAASLIIITEERKKNVDFSIPYYIGGTALGTLKSAEEMSNVFRAEDFEGKTFAVWTGTIADQIVQQHIKDVKLLYYNTPQEFVEAVRTRKADATMHDEPIIRKYIAGRPELKILYPYVTHDEYGVVFNKQSSDLRDSYNQFLKEIKDNGVHDDIVLRWIDTAKSPAMPEIPLTGENGTLVFGTTGLDEPFSYIQDGKPTGFDVELAYRFAQYMGMQLEITLMDFGALIPAVQSGKVDFAGDLFTITEARKEFIDFSDPTYIGGMVVMVRDENAAATTSFWQSIQKSFHQNLIVENRWRMVLQGLGVTAVISIFSLLFGTLLGFFICFMAMSKLRLLNAFANVYTMLLRGTPMVVLLMIIYYIVFAKVNLSPIYVAIIAFGLNGGAFIGEIIRSAILTVDKGQVEAARSMGFSKSGAFLTVTLPQAVRVAFPVYKSEFISMVKGTAIVGYIAIQDLTKAGDIIRSRTYDAFFPLIAVAIVYLLIIGAFLWLFNRIEKLTDKRTRRDRA